jgi:N-acetylneuraminate synthase
MKIKNKTLGYGKPTFFIADIAANHDGSLDRAIDLIKRCAEAGADAAKFQHFKADTIVSDLGFKKLGEQKSHQKEWKKTIYETYKDASLNMDWTSRLKEECDKQGIIFFTSPYDLKTIDELDQFIPAYKIGSGDITFSSIIEKIASKNKPYFLATGAASMEDIDRAVNLALKINKDLLLMQCNTNYTGSLENFKFINLKVLNLFKKKYPNLLLGLSDHTPGHSTVLGAVALGACAIEKHFTDDNNRNGPDHPFSMNPKSWKEMVQRTRELEKSLGEEKKKVEDNEKETVILQRRAVRASHDLNADHTITEKDLIMLRPCPKEAISPYEFKKVLNKKLKNDIKNGDIIKWSDLD